MTEKILTKDNQKEFLSRLIKDYQVFAPVEKDGNLLFSQIDTPEELAEEYRNTKQPPKELFFPHSEALFRFRKGQAIEESPNEAERVIFGMRPCDAKSLILLDMVFNAEGFKDPYFIARREKTTIISIACAQPQITCFCTSCGTSPVSEEGSDILLFDLGANYLVKSITPKGQQLIDNLGGLLTDAQKSDLKKRDELVKTALAKMKSEIPTEGLKEKLEGMFDSPIWEKIHLKCLGCGICTYLCPTCHCFDIVDEAVDSEGKRVRNWDSCMYPQFTIQASGVNPRLSNKERLRQRMMHKFNYSVSNYGQTFCVGCGRCVRNCPVNLDIREIVKLGSGK
ncbi:MAG: 4Fe-4S dicluster domain-containing protein [Candidatus Latescibacteria bacterium]|nr:4Fe-4S dicluster domain-containing protein [Candidatus Latescibacterota bacterium]